MWLPARPGVMACGLLDFQDAQQGHCFLRPRVADRGCPPRRLAGRARRLPGALHRTRPGSTRKDFDTGFALMARAAPRPHHRAVHAAWRSATASRDYLPHLPRVWRHVRSVRCGTRHWLPLRAWVDRHLPPRRCGVIGARNDRKRDDPGRRARRAYAASHRHHAQAAHPDRRTVADRALDRAAGRARRGATSSSTSIISASRSSSG